MAFIMLCSIEVHGHLRSRFYDKTCPKALSTVKAAVKQLIDKDNRNAAAMLQLQFHDCFVRGCDGSVLLDDSPTIIGEKTAAPNANNSVRGFDLIDTIKAQVEAVCTGVVSCADLVALAARDSVVALGGPTWRVMLGRRDSTNASLSTANTQLPPSSSNLTSLISFFSAKGLSPKDLVALSGAHTIGKAQCKTYRARIYNDTNIDPSFAASIKAVCPSTRGIGDFNLSRLDLQTPFVFDNSYYKNLIAKKGLFHSDQELFNGVFTDSQVITYSTNQTQFFVDFANAMMKMGKINPLTGRNGQIRKNCRKPN
ncbi:hypothetical protein SUGI_0236290 [Cryptomeria japonica]|nr:hypothetical protein SUGI_0236290 [Cryptomeria japonica]